MGVSDLIERIERDGRERVAAIDAERDRQVAEIQQRAAVEAEALVDSSAAAARREAEQLVRQAEGVARLMLRNARLAARWCLVDRVLAMALERFRQLPEYQSRLAELVRSAQSAGGTVAVGVEDASVLREGGLKVEVAPIKGGAIVSYQRYDKDHTLDSMIEDVRRERLAPLVTELFPTDGN